jgi:hypothetical protein
MGRCRITEAEAERIIDRRLMRALETDRAYLNAEDAESQDEREDVIEGDVWAAISREYQICGADED